MCFHLPSLLTSTPRRLTPPFTMTGTGRKQWDGLLLTFNGIAMCQTGEAYSQIQDEKESEMQITRVGVDLGVGVDLAKNVFQIHGVDGAGRTVWRRQLKRSNWLKVLNEKLEPGCEIGMEACGGAHHWAR